MVNWKAVGIGTFVIILLNFIVSAVAVSKGLLKSEKHTAYSSNNGFLIALFLVFLAGGVISGWMSKAEPSEGAWNGAISGILAIVIGDIIDAIAGFYSGTPGVGGVIGGVIIAGVIAGAGGYIGGKLGSYSKEVKNGNI